MLVTFEMNLQSAIKRLKHKLFSRRHMRLPLLYWSLEVMMEREELEGNDVANDG